MMKQDQGLNIERQKRGFDVSVPGYQIRIRKYEFLDDHIEVYVTPEPYCPKFNYMSHELYINLDSLAIPTFVSINDFPKVYEGIDKLKQGLQKAEYAVKITKQLIDELENESRTDSQQDG